MEPLEKRDNMEDRWEQIKQLFEGARRLPEVEHKSFLRRECDDDALQNEVLSLLNAHGEATGFFEQFAGSVVAPAWDALQEASESGDPLQIEGKEVDRYRIEEHLGGGGMGVVYKARDTVLERPVALKFLSPHLATMDEAEVRFLREAKAASSLDHPNIATIYAIGSVRTGESQTQRRFIAMGYYDGRTLRSLIEGGPLTVEEALDYAVQIGKGLAVAHGSGIIHRDVKPGNIIVTPGGTLKLVDFGLAKATAVSRITHTGRRLGTAAYMSPEQARGEEVDGRSDIWSLGVILYEMLTGKRPFYRGRDIATLYAILHEEPVPLRGHQEDLADELEHIVERCLAKVRNYRYESAKSLLGDLRAVQRGELPEEATLHLKHRDGGNRRVAVLPFETLSTDGPNTLSSGLYGDVLTRLSTVADLHVISKTTVKKYDQTGKSTREVGAELGVRWLVEGEVQQVGQQFQVNARLFDAQNDSQQWGKDFRRKLTAENIFQVQDEITKEIVNALEAKLSPQERERLERQSTENLGAYRLYVQGRRRLDQRTADGMRKAVKCFERAIEQDESYAIAWAGLADALAELYDYGHAPAQETLPRAEEAAQRAITLNPMLSEAHASIGLIHSNRHEGLAAIRELKRAVKIKPSYAEAHNWLSWNYQLLGNAKEALQSAERAVELDPLSPEAVSNLCASSLANGRFEKALREAERAHEIEPTWPSVLFYEGVALYHLGQFDEAKNVLDGVIAPWAGSGPLVTKALSHIGLGERKDALSIQKKLQRDEDHFGVGLLHAAFGEVDEAFARFDQVTFWDDWPTLSVHGWYPDVLNPLRENPRFEPIANEVKKARRKPAVESDKPSKAALYEEKETSNQVQEQERAVASIAVLPFTVFGENDSSSFVDGTHDDLLSRLSVISGVEIISRTSVMRYRSTDKSLPEIGKELGAEWIVEGSVQQPVDVIRLRVRLVDARTDRQVWTEDYRRHFTADNIFELQADVTRKIVGAIQARLTSTEQKRVNQKPTDNLEAYQLYVQGRAHLHERTGESMQKAAQFFKQAIDLDEEYALAWSGLADACALLRGYDYEYPVEAPEPLKAARRALELAPTLGEAHASLGIIQAYLYQNGPAAIRAFKKATQVKPSYAETYVWQSWVYLLIGKPQLALEPAQTAVRLNPLAPAYRIFLAESYLVRNQTDEALREARRAREIQPKFGLAHYMEALALYHRNDYEGALSILEDFESLVLPSWGVPSHSEFRAFIAVIEAISGDHKRTQALLSRLRDDGDTFSIGLVQAALGEVDNAFEAFGRVENWISFETDHIRYFFPKVLETVRNDARYEDLMQKVDAHWGLKAG